MPISLAQIAAWIVALVAPVAQVAAEPPCAPHWRDTGFKAGLIAELGGVEFNATVYALGADLGDGAPALFAAGTFTTAFGEPLSRVGRWTGEQWQPFGAGVSGTVRALTMFDAGAGDELVVGGSFTSAAGEPTLRLARWNGGEWLPLGDGVNAAPNALAVFDDGCGPALYAAGEFTQAGGQPASHIARWNGSNWSPLGDGVDGVVHALTVFDDGGGPRLVAAGAFLNAGGQPAKHVAAWDGRAWSPVGGELDATVHALEVVDFGGGPQLIAGGTDGSNGTVHSWNGVDWTPLGDGGGVVLALHATTFDGAPALLVGGFFSSFGAGLHSNISARGIIRFDGTNWKKMGATEIDGAVQAIATLPADNAGNPVYYIGGTFNYCDGSLAEAIARWNGDRWERVQPPSPGLWTDGIVHDVATLMRDGEPMLIAAGEFRAAGGEPIPTIAAWRDGVVEPLGEPPPGNATGLFPSTLEPGVLYAVGAFEDDDGLSSTVFGLLRWDGSAWTGLARITNTSGVTSGYAIAEHDDGTGMALILAGRFDTIDGVPAPSVARFDGVAWAPMGTPFSTFSQALALATYDAGDGPRLYVAGSGFTSGFGGDRVLAWNGAAWAGIGLAPSQNSAARALQVHDDGTGSKLYVVGDFGQLMRWDGRTLEAVAAIVSGRRAMLSHDFGDGPRLLVAGFQQATVPAIAWWNGNALVPLPGVLSTETTLSTDGKALGLASLPEGRLLACGEFRWLNEVAGSRPLANLAVYDPSAAPWIVDDPDAAIAFLGGTATFSTRLFENPPAAPVTYQWRRNGVDLVDDGHLVGAATAELNVVGVTARDVGEYDVIVANACGDAVSAAAALVVTCDGDVDGDGMVAASDLGALLAAWGTSDVASDLDGDGAVGESDLAALLAAWGVCG